MERIEKTARRWWYRACSRCSVGDMELAQDREGLVRRCLACGFEETIAPTQLRWRLFSSNTCGLARVPSVPTKNC